MSATQLIPIELAPVANVAVTGDAGFNREPQPLHLEMRFLQQSCGLGVKIQKFTKRVLDVVLATAGLIALSPLLLVIALMIKLTSPGPVIYKSLRIGKNYQPFHMYKFRTMHVNADSMRDELRKQAKLEGNLFKLANDPRIIPVGKVLRATSLDELPQLVNVILGQMSLVGPRPLPPDESYLFQAPYTLRYHVTPGITGIWQVSGRSKLDFKQFCKLELTYVLHWNLWEDIRILLKTVPAVLSKSGAC